MKTSGIIGVAVALVVLIALTGCAMADRNVCATPETQAITTSETVVVTGTMTSTEALTWTVASDSAINTVYKTGLAPNPFVGQNSQYTTGYSEETKAIDGSTTFVKTFSVDTANKVLNQQNVKAYRQIQYVSAGNGARMTSAETLFVDGVADPALWANTMLCPFAATQPNDNPPYCNIVTAGSNMDVTQVNVVTNANDRFVNGNGDYPVTLHYDISAKGFTLEDGTTVPAMGGVSAFVRAHIMEGREASINPVNGQILKAADLTYSELTTASGLIYNFNKVIDYQSGVRRV
ncbi:MAG: hypothetical protein NT074_06625 [Methanomicrobiales archaeon]|nr:hypothetical protein [Methanomicrobiales archaeon]